MLKNCYAIDLNFSVIRNFQDKHQCPWKEQNELFHDFGNEKADSKMAADQMQVHLDAMYTFRYGDS